MPLQSDLSLNAFKFDTNNVPPGTTELNNHLIKVMQGIPKWYEVGAERYRQMRWNNETPLPRPPVLESGRNEKIPSRDEGRDIPIRFFLPENGKAKGVFMHIHGGGWVLQSEAYQDGLLNLMAQKANIAVVSVGYRLAPEHPFPAGPEDCFDAAEYLVKNSEARFGAPLLFVGGESAGGHLSVLTLLHLHRVMPSFKFRALILHFGAYDLSGWLPAAHNFDKPLILDKTIISAYADAFLPGLSEEDRRDPSISPFFANWNKIARDMNGLPPALFTCGTEDPLLDDSVMMAVKWQMTGAEAVLKIYPGAPHGFIGFDAKLLQAAGEGLRDLEEYLVEKVG